MNKVNKIFILLCALPALAIFSSCSKSKNTISATDGTIEIPDTDENKTNKETVTTSDEKKDTTKETDASDFTYSIVNDEVEIVKYIGNGVDVIIPNKIEDKSVTSIGDCAFFGCSSLTSITIPYSVISIGLEAFSDCYSLVEVINKSSLNITKGNTDNGWIGFYALNIKSKGTSDIVNINDYLFYIYGNVNYLIKYIGNDTELTLPESFNGKIYEIYECAFYNCNLESVTIPNGVTSIGSSAFNNCSNLISITIPDSVKSIGDYAFERCSSLTSITIPDSVKSIGVYAFERCSSLTSITIPDSVTSVGRFAFYNCNSLLEVINKSSLNIIKGSTGNGYIGYYALNIKTEGTSDIVNINDYLFYTYDNVNYLIKYIGNDTELILPESYNGKSYEIYKYSFYKCSSLTSITIPDSVTNIGDGAFSGFYSLVEVINKSSLNITKGSTDNGCIGYCALNIKTEGTSDIVNINDYLFYTYDNVNYLIKYIGSDTELTLPESYNGSSYEIYKFAFYNNDKITSVTIPDSITSIGDYAFYGCSCLKSVLLPASVTSIGDSALNRCNILRTIYYNGTIENWINISARNYELSNSINFYILDENGGIEFNDNKYSRLTEVVIPDSITTIPGNTFSNISSITSVIIPDSVTTIGDYAFRECSSLTSITIPDSVTSIGRSAFSRCSSLTSITIPDSITSIGDYAFYICSSLTSVTIPESVTSIGSSAFSGCSSLTSITIPDSVTSIGDYAFEGCSSLTSITIPNSVTSIGKYAFFVCSSLTSVTIPSGATIGTYAFYSCNKLKTIYYSGSNTDWNKISIGFTDSPLSNAIIYYYSETQPTDTTYKYWHYVDGEPTIWD